MTDKLRTTDTDIHTGGHGLGAQWNKELVKADKGLWPANLEYNKRGTERYIYMRRARLDRRFQAEGLPLNEKDHPDGMTARCPPSAPLSKAWEATSKSQPCSHTSAYEQTYQEPNHYGTAT